LVIGKIFIKKLKEENHLDINKPSFLYNNSCKGVIKKMPVYRLKCEKCNLVFEELFFTYNEAKEATCPDCGAKLKILMPTKLRTQKVTGDQELLEDAEEYREMHYYEKQGDYEKAAKAAEGVNDFAHKKFIQKAREKEVD
jgi:putative FmdB family regulatory protein